MSLLSHREQDTARKVITPLFEGPKTRTEIADKVGVRPETVSRYMNHVFEPGSLVVSEWTDRHYYNEKKWKLSWSPTRKGMLAASGVAASMARSGEDIELGFGFFEKMADKNESNVGNQSVFDRHVFRGPSKED